MRKQQCAKKCSFEFYATSYVFEFRCRLSAVYWRDRPPFATAEVAAAEDAYDSDSVAILAYCRAAGLGHW